jgi:hypothetical protein
MANTITSARRGCRSKINYVTGGDRKMKTVWIAMLISAELKVSVADATEVLKYRFADQSLMHATNTSGNDIRGR